MNENYGLTQQISHKKMSCAPSNCPVQINCYVEFLETNIKYTLSMDFSFHIFKKFAIFDYKHLQIISHLKS